MNPLASPQLSAVNLPLATRISWTTGKFEYYLPLPTGGKHDLFDIYILQRKKIQATTSDILVHYLFYCHFYSP